MQLILHSKQEKIWENMTSCKQLKNILFLLLYYIKTAYFVRERIELFIGLYISMKSTFHFKPESSDKMVKTSKFVSQKLNKKQHFWVMAFNLILKIYINDRIKNVKTTQHFLMLLNILYSNI